MAEKRALWTIMAPVPGPQGRDMEGAWARPVKHTAFGQAEAGVKADLPWQQPHWQPGGAGPWGGGGGLLV